MLPPQYAINLKLSALSLPLYQLRGKGKLKKSKASFVDGELDKSDAGWKLFCSGKNMRSVKLEGSGLN